MLRTLSTRRFHLAAAISLALALVACHRPDPPANVHRPMPSPDGRHLALMSDRDGNWELYLIDLTDGTSRRVTHDPAFDGYADFSPDGSSLYFGRSGDLLRFDVEAGTEHPLGEGGALRVSPDGTEIVFQSERSGDREIYLMASDGSRVRRLTENPGNDADPVFSPDGTRIAFVSAIGERQEIVVMNRDGSGRRQLTQGVVDAYGTDWSPDGRYLAYCAVVDGDRELFRIEVESGEIHRLTRHPGTDHQPVFWPDGTRILYTSEEGEHEQLWMIRVDGSKPTRLEPSPDGRLTRAAREALSRRPDTLVLAGVHVVPMDREAILRDRTVVVRDGRIAAIEGPGFSDAPAGARVVAGEGRYLIPGLMDLHAHPDTAGALQLYLAHGVTTVRDMGGDLQHLERRDRVASGALAGPTVYVAGPVLHLEGDQGDQQLRDPESARRIVREIAAAGYDLIKVVRIDPPATVAAVIDEARQAGLRVAGHLPTFDWTLAQLAGSGMASVEHVTELGWLAFEGRTDSAEISAAVETLARGGLGVGALLTSGLRAKQMIELGEAYLDTADAAEMARWHGPAAAETTRGYLEYLAAAEPPAVERRLIDRRFTLEFLAALYRGGVLLVTGTDSHTAWAIAGISLHDELALFVEAGLSPYEALRTATVHGAALLGIEGEAGTIEPGNRADLVLVDGNPLEDLAALRHPDAVVAAGRWYDAEDLRLLLAEALIGEAPGS